MSHHSLFPLFLCLAIVYFSHVIMHVECGQAIPGLDPTFGALMNQLDDAIASLYTDLETSPSTSTEDLRILLATQMAKTYTHIAKDRCQCSQNAHNNDQCLNEWLEGLNLANVSNGCDVYQLATQFYSRKNKENNLSCKQSMDLLCAPYTTQQNTLGALCNFVTSNVCADSSTMQAKCSTL